jgi:hypothetical protein
LKGVINVYLDEVDRIAKILLDKYPEPDLKTGKAKRDYWMRWVEHYIIAKTLMMCYDALDTHPNEIFGNEWLEYSLAVYETRSEQKRKIYLVYSNTLEKACSIVKDILK